VKKRAKWTENSLKIFLKYYKEFADLDLIEKMLKENK
jgi:hypothetical protein